MLILQFGVPSFSLKFPHFQLSGAWKKSLYGGAKSEPVELPQGQLSLHVHPSLGDLNVGLSWDGAASFDAPGWKLGVSPIGFTLASPKLFRADGLHLLQSEDGEIGISFDKNSSRHFFLIAKSLPSLKFSLHLNVCFPPSPSPTSHLDYCCINLVISSWMNHLELTSTKRKE